MSPMCRTPSRPRWAATRVSQVLQGEQRYDLVLRYLPPYPRHQGSHREHPPAVAHRASASRWRSSATFRVLDGASEIYREGNSRYVAIKYSVRGRDLGSTVEEAIDKVDTQVKLPDGYQHQLGRRVREPAARAKAAGDRAARSRFW